MKKVIWLVFVILQTGCQHLGHEPSCLHPGFQVARESLPEGIFGRLRSAPGVNPKREEEVRDYFSAHCDSVDQQPVSRRLGSNVLCRVEGRSPDEILVGAHHDRTGAGHGVADNWTGIVLLSHLLARVSEGRPDKTWIFAAFAAEESGLEGSRTWIRKHGAGKLIAMVNLDTLATGMLTADVRSNPELTCIAGSLARDLRIDFRKTSLPDATGDWFPFRQNGIPVLSLHSLDRQTMKKIHTGKDSIRMVSRNRLEEAWQLLFNLQRYLDQTPNMAWNWSIQDSRSVPSSSVSSTPM